MRNLLVGTIKGKLTCGAFLRPRGRYEVVCSHIRPTGDVTFASYGTYPDRDTATEIAKDVIRVARRSKNPFEQAWNPKIRRYYSPVTSEVTIKERTLLYHLATATQKESVESYLRRRFGGEILDKLHKERLIGREPKGIYYITLRGREIAGKIPPRGANLYAEAKKMLEEGLEIKPAIPKAPVVPEVTLDEQLKAFEAMQKAKIPAEAEFIKQGLADYEEALRGTGFPLNKKLQTEIIKKEYRAKYPAIPKAVAPEVAYTVTERGGQGVAVKWSIPEGTVELIRTGANKGKYLAKIGDLEFTSKTRETAVSGAKEYLAKHPELAIPKAKSRNPIRNKNPMSKRRNITMARTKTDEEIWQSARKKFIDSFSKPLTVPRTKVRRPPGMPDPFGHVTEKDREQAWKRGCII